MLPKKPPRNFHSRSDRGIDNIEVRLVAAPEPYEAADAISAFAQATFGGEYGFSYDRWRVARRACDGREVIPNSLETVSLTFEIHGVSRATTHQLVRTRVGAAFGQHSQRANPQTGFNVRLPASFDLMKPEVLEKYLDSLPHLRRFYEAALAAGVPYQDARYVLPEGTETGLVVTYNLLALKSTLQRRLCNRMQWEINYVARRMHDLAVRALPFIGRSMRTRCEQTGVCQTMDPMFEASCLHWDGTHVLWCRDNDSLIRQHGGDRNWPQQSNDAVLFFEGIDRKRLAYEAANPQAVYSMTDFEVLVSNYVTGEDDDDE